MKAVDANARRTGPVPGFFSLLPCVVLPCVFLLCVVMLAGCSSSGQSFLPWDQQRRAPVVAESDEVTLRLARAAETASAALNELAEIEQGRFGQERAVQEAVADLPAELSLPVTVSWNGPIEPISRRLADRVGYRFIEVGERPPVPVVIDLEVVNRPAVEVLRDVGLQAGRRADVVVDAGLRVIEVRYAPVTGR